MSFIDVDALLDLLSALSIMHLLLYCSLPIIIVLSLAAIIRELIHKIKKRTHKNKEQEPKQNKKGVNKHG